MKYLKYCLILLIFSGCTNFGGRVSQQKFKLDEYVRETVQAASISNSKTIESLNTNSVSNAQAAASITKEFLDRTETMVGSPSKNQQETVNKLLSTNELLRISEEFVQKHRSNKESELVAQIKGLEKKLINYGQEFEEQRNEKIKSIVKWSLIGLVAIGGPIALMVLFPPLLGGFVSLFPSLIKVFKAVPLNSVTRLSKGISEIRTSLKHKALNGEAEQKFKPTEILQLIDNSLKANTDEKDKKIINLLRGRFE